MIVSEQGDARRFIGIYGDAINIAARMEQAAKAHGVSCILSADVVDALTNRAGMQMIGEESVTMEVLSLGHIDEGNLWRC